MRTEPVTIRGLAGPVVVTMNTFTGRSSVTVNGAPVQGGRRGGYDLPTANGGTVPAKVRANLLDPYPIIEVGGVKHRTGPQVPAALRVLTLLPLILVLGGAIGGLLGGVGAVTNLAVARTRQSTAAKAGIMVLVLLAAAVAYVVVASAVLGDG